MEGAIRTGMGVYSLKLEIEGNGKKRDREIKFDFKDKLAFFCLN